VSLLRIIVWVILLFIAAKIIGSVLRFVRSMLSPPRDTIKSTTKNPEPYSNVEDVPYEEVPDKK
jgi:hypothetical protein